MQSYEDWAQARADPRFTDWLRGLVEPVWELPNPTATVSRRAAAPAG